MDSLRMPAGWKLWLAVSLSTLVLVLLCTRPYNYVDSLSYALHIVSHAAATDPWHDPFWDFGHPLWRPAGGAVWSLFRGPIETAFPTDPALGAAVVLIGFSMLAVGVSCVLLFLLVARATGKAWIAGIVTIGYVATDAVMNFSGTGTAYMTGGAFQFGGIYVIFRAIQGNRLTMWRGVLAGVLLGLSMGVWFPYCLPIPGFLCFGLLWPGAGERNIRARLRFLFPLAAAAGVVLLTVYAAIMSRVPITSIAMAREWATRSTYGIEPNLGYLRMLAGIVRSFFYLGQDAVTWKRVLLGGGAHPSLAAIASTGIWKVVLLYAVFAWVALRLWRPTRNRALIASMAVCAVPMLYFAAFLFDPGPPERYYAVFPLLFLAFGCVMAEDGLASKAIPIVFFATMLAANTSAMWRFDHNRGYEDAIARLNTIDRQVGPNDLILVVSFPDSVFRFVQARPFDPLSRYRYLVHPVFEEGTRKLPFWRRHVATLALDSWSRGGHVWITTRLLAASPRPEWGWVEGDAPVPWETLPEFFHSLDLLSPVGGADSFVEMPPTGKNRDLMAVAAQP